MSNVSLDRDYPQRRRPTIPASSRIEAAARAGAKIATSSRCSCPLNSIFVSPDGTSHMRAV